MDGKTAIYQLLAIHNLTKYESYYDDTMSEAVQYAIDAIVKMDNIDRNEIPERR